MKTKISTATIPTSALSLLASLLLAAPVWAGPIAVDTTAASSPGLCTLASAVAAAQLGDDVEGCAWDGEAVVELAADTYRLADQITVSGNVTVRGNGATLVRDDPAVQHRFFRVQGELHLHQLTLTGGDRGQARGGAVKVAAGATFSAHACTFHDNHADWAGGAIYSLGSTLVELSTFSGNTTNNQGGAIYAADGTLTVERCTFHDNRGIRKGGGAILAEADVSIDTSTFSANSAVWGGALYQGAGRATVALSTFKDNTATAVTGGGTFYVDSGAVLTLDRSAVVGDAQEDLCWGTVTSLGDNAAGDDSCGLTAAGDQQDVTILLSDLVDHGGVTRVHVPLCNGWLDGECQSPLLDRYDCDAFPSSQNPLWDQRNQFPRRVDFPQPHGYPSTGDRCDVGAYESGCQTVYWTTPDRHQVVRLFREQSASSTALLDNGACYAHQVDFDEGLSQCSLQWEIYGGLLEITDVVFIEAGCPHDCFTDPQLCAQSCATTPPGGWMPALQQPSGGFQFDIPSCEAPEEDLRYIIEYVSSLNPQELLYWDPRVPLEPPG